MSQPRNHCAPITWHCVLDGRKNNLRILVFVVIYDSGWVSLEHFLLSWYPSHILGGCRVSTDCSRVSDTDLGPFDQGMCPLSIFCSRGTPPREARTLPTTPVTALPTHATTHSSEACFASREEGAPSHLAVSVVEGCGRGALRFAGEMGEEGRVLFCDRILEGFGWTLAFSIASFRE